MYGNGVHFARDASFSTQTKYSPPDRTGNHYMYLAHVLVGEYAAGRQGMITSPSPSPSPSPPATPQMHTAYDRVGNPKVLFVCLFFFL